jgi:protein SCO1/2
MKRYFLLAALGVAGLAGCARRDPSELEPPGALAREAFTGARAPAPLATAVSLPPAAPAKAEALPPSIYDLPLQLTDDTGATRTLASFRGHPVLITMFYGSCASACPLLTVDLKRIERALPESVRANVRILMVSFDAARDKPSVLARLKLERAMDATRWTLASADDEGARELAGVLGIRYRKLDDGAFFHSSAIVLLDAGGRPLVRLDGLGKDPAPVVTALSTPSS